MRSRTSIRYSKQANLERFCSNIVCSMHVACMSLFLVFAEIRSVRSLWRYNKSNNLPQVPVRSAFQSIKSSSTTFINSIWENWKKKMKKNSFLTMTIGLEMQWIMDDEPVYFGVSLTISEFRTGNNVNVMLDAFKFTFRKTNICKKQQNLCMHLELCRGINETPQLMEIYSNFVHFSNILYRYLKLGIQRKTMPSHCFL